MAEEEFSLSDVVSAMNGCWHWKQLKQRLGLDDAATAEGVATEIEQLRAALRDAVDEIHAVIGCDQHCEESRHHLVGLATNGSDT